MSSIRIEYSATIKQLQIAKLGCLGAIVLISAFAAPLLRAQTIDLSGISCSLATTTDPATMALTYWPERYGSLNDAEIDPELEETEEIKDVESALKLFRFYDYYYPSHRFPRIKKRLDRSKAKAVQLIAASLQEDPCDTAMWDKWAYLMIEENDYLRLKMLSAQLVEAIPDYFKGYMSLGLAEYQLRNYKEAEAAFQKGLDQIPHDRVAEFISLDDLLQPEELDDYRANAIQYTHTYFRPFDPRYLSAFNERELGHLARVVYSDIAFPLWRKHNADEWLLSPGDFVLRYGIPRNTSVATKDRPPYDRTISIAFEKQNWQFTDLFRNGEYFLQGLQLEWARDTVRVTPQQYELPGQRFMFKPPTQIACFQSEKGGLVDVYASFGVPLSGDKAYRENAIFETGLFLMDSTGVQGASSTGTFFGLLDQDIKQVGDYSYWIRTRKVESKGFQSGSAILEINSDTERVFGRYQMADFKCIYSDDEISMSDMLVSSMVEESATRSPGSIPRPGHQIWPSAVLEFDQTEPMYVYSEIYGAENHQLTSETSLVPIRDGLQLFDRLFGGNPAEDRVSVQIQIQPSSNFEPQYRIVDLTDVEPGRYVLGYAIRDAISGNVVAYRTREITVR